MGKDKIKSQIFRTDEFFVENRNEKKMYLLRKSDLIFNKIANAIELQNKLERKEKFKRDRSKKQRETRIAKRTYYYEFYLFDNDYDYKKVEKEHLPIGLVLGKNDFTLNTDYEGLFKGSEITLIDFLDSLYDE